MTASNKFHEPKPPEKLIMHEAILYLEDSVAQQCRDLVYEAAKKRHPATVRHSAYLPTCTR